MNVVLFWAGKYRLVLPATWGAVMVACNVYALRRKQQRITPPMVRIFINAYRGGAIWQAAGFSSN